MCNWRKWVLPGILATAVLTALAMLFHAGAIERDLAAKATAALEQDHSWATATLDGRDLTLMGTAPSTQAQTSAIDLTAAINDVRTVRDNSTLPPIQAPFVFEAQKGQGGIVMSGFAPSEEARVALLSSARAAHEGVSITDQLQIARGAPDGFADLAGFGLTQLARLAEGDVKTNDEEFSIVGSAATSDDFAMLNEALAGVLPGGGALVANEVTAPRISPYQWSATRASDGTLTLDGFAPDSATLASIMDAATRTSAGGPLDNNLQIGAGAPEGFASATERGLETLAGMTSGQAVIEAQTLRVEGETFGQAALDAMAETLQAAALEGFQIEPNITVSPGPLAPGGSGALEPAQCLTRLSEILSGSQIRFSTGDATIEPASFPLLDQLAYVARACPQTQLEIGGHTDADGDENANQELSLRRAVSVLNYLIVARVSSARLTAVGYGETSPLASNDTAEGKAQNRRIEFKIIQ